VSTPSASKFVQTLTYWHNPAKCAGPVYRIGKVRSRSQKAILMGFQRRKLAWGCITYLGRVAHTFFPSAGVKAPPGFLAHFYTGWFHRSRKSNWRNVWDECTLQHRQTPTDLARLSPQGSSSFWAAGAGWRLLGGGGLLGAVVLAASADAATFGTLRTWTSASVLADSATSEPVFGGMAPDERLGKYSSATPKPPRYRRPRRRARWSRPRSPQRARSRTAARTRAARRRWRPRRCAPRPGGSAAPSRATWGARSARHRPPEWAVQWATRRSKAARRRTRAPSRLSAARAIWPSANTSHMSGPANLTRAGWAPSWAALASTASTSWSGKRRAAAALTSTVASAGPAASTTPAKTRLRRSSSTRSTSARNNAPTGLLTQPSVTTHATPTGQQRAPVVRRLQLDPVVPAQAALDAQRRPAPPQHPVRPGGTATLLRRVVVVRKLIVLVGGRKNQPAFAEIGEHLNTV